MSENIICPSQTNIDLFIASQLFWKKKINQLVCCLLCQSLLSVFCSFVLSISCSVRKLSLVFLTVDMCLSQTKLFCSCICFTCTCCPNYVTFRNVPVSCLIHIYRKDQTYIITSYNGQIKPSFLLPGYFIFCSARILCEFLHCGLHIIFEVADK